MFDRSDLFDAESCVLKENIILALLSRLFVAESSNSKDKWGFANMLGQFRGNFSKYFIDSEAKSSLNLMTAFDLINNHK